MDISSRLFYGSLILLILVATVTIWGEVIGLALLVEHLGLHALPPAFILEALFSILWITLLDRLKGKLHDALLTILIVAVGAAMLFIGWELTEIGYQTFGYVFYFLARRFIGDLLLYYTWQYVASYYDLGVRYLLPQLAFISRIGSAAGGLAFALAAPFLETRSAVITLWGAGLLGAVLAIAVFTDEMQGFPRNIQSTENLAAALPTRLLNLTRSFRQSRLMGLLSFAIFAALLLSTLIIYRTVFVFDEVFHAEAALLRALAVVYGLSGLVTVPLQYRVLPDVLQKYPVTTPAMLYPGTLGVIYLLVFLFPVLGIAALGELGRVVLQGGLFEPVEQRIKNTLPATLHLWERLILDGLFAPLGRLLAGLLLLLFAESILPAALLVLIGLLAAAGFVYVQQQAGQLHISSLKQSLAAGQYGFLRPSMQDPLSTNRDVVERLLKRLHRLDPGDRDVILIVHALAETGSEEGFQAVMALWKQCPPHLQAELLLQIVQGWSRHKHEAEIRELVTVAVQSNVPELRRAALQVMIAYRSLLDPYQVANYLIDPEPTISTLAAQNLLQHSAPKLARAAEAQLNWLSRAGNAATRALAVNALVAGGTNRFGERIIVLDVPRFQHDPSARVRVAVVPALNLQELILSVQDVSPAVRQAATQRLLEHPRRSIRLLHQALSENLMQIERRQIDAMIQRWYLLTTLVTLSPAEGRELTLREVERNLRHIDLLCMMRKRLRELHYPSIKSIIAEISIDRAQLIRGSIGYLSAMFGATRVRTSTRALQLGEQSEELEFAMNVLTEITTPALAEKIGELLRHPLDEDHLLMGDSVPGVEQIHEVVYILLAQKNPWRSIVTLYALSAMPPVIFEAFTDAEQVSNLLNAAQRSDTDAIRETIRMIRLAMKEGIAPYHRKDSLLSRAIPLNRQEKGSHMLSTVERMIFLRNVSFFENLRLDQLRTLARICIEQAFNAGEFILHKGEAGDSLFIVVEGQVRVVDPQYGQEEGVLAILKAGEVLGEISLFDGGLRSADAIAQTDCLLLVVHRESLDDALGDDPGIALDMLRVMAQRIRRSNRALARVSQQINLKEQVHDDM